MSVNFSVTQAPPLAKNNRTGADDLAGRDELVGYRRDWKWTVLFLNESILLVVTITIPSL
jgi:hypothetical protein